GHYGRRRQSSQRIHPIRLRMTRIFLIIFRIWLSPGKGGPMREYSLANRLSKGQEISSKKTDYEIELQRIDAAIAEVESTVPSLPIDSGRTTKSLYLSYQRGSLTGNLDALMIVENEINAAIREIGPAGDLYFLKANLDFE